MMGAPQRGVGSIPAQQTIVAINPDPALKAALSVLIAAAQGWELDICEGHAPADRFTAYAQIVGLDPARGDALQEFKRLMTGAPDAARVIAAIAHATPELVRQLFRAGAADVIAGPFTADGLRSALGDLRQARGSGSGRVISIIKGCGGAGATTLALNLAALSATGDAKRSQAPCATVLLDLDLQFGDTDVGLDMKPRTGLLDLLQAGARVDQQFFESALTEHASGFKLLAPPASVVPLSALDARSACGMLDYAASTFARTFVDHPAGWSEWTFPVLARSDAIILVTSGSVSGALGARRVLNALRDADVQQPVFLVLNRMAGLLESVERPAEIAAALKLPVTASLPFDAAVIRAADRGQPLVSAFPKSPVVRELRKLLHQLDTRPVTTEPAISLSEIAG